MRVVFAGQHGTGPNGDFLRAAFAAETYRDAGAAVLVDGHRQLRGDGHGRRRAHVRVVARRGRTSFSADLCAGRASARRLGVRLWLHAELSRQPRRAWPTGSRRCRQKFPLCFDPTPVVSDIPETILSRVLARTTWLSCNAAEAAAIAGTDRYRGQCRAAAAPSIARKPAGVVIRSGEAGAFVVLRDGTSQTIPGFKVAAVDTNGAGDTHIGAFVSALARGAGAVRGGALRQRGGRHLRHPARRIVRADRRRDRRLSRRRRSRPEQPIRTARKINGLTQANREERT